MSISNSFLQVWCCIWWDGDERGGEGEKDNIKTTEATIHNTTILSFIWLWRWLLFQAKSFNLCARAPRIINSNASFHSFIKQVACCGMHRMLVGGIFSQLAGSDWFYRYTLYIFYRWSDFIFHITTPNDHKRSETQQSKTCVLWDGIFTSNKLLLRSSLSSFRHFFVIQQKINNCMNNNS